MKKFTNVCTAWREFILGSKYLTGDCKYFCLQLSDRTVNEALDYVQSGFISIVEEITFSETPNTRNKMDTLGFVRDHVKDKTTALTKFHIDVNDFTNIEAWSEILARSPEASTFDINFEQSDLESPTQLDIQSFAERFWKVLLAVFYCNSKDKTLSIGGICSHYPLKAVDWSFAKNEYKQYRNVQNPGTVKEFELPSFCPYNNSSMFYTAPIWDQVPIDRVTIRDGYNSVPFIDYDLSQFTNNPFKCVQLRFNIYNDNLPSPSSPWTYFSNCEKLEIYFSDINQEDKIKIHNILKLIKHPNLHVVLGCPIRVSDANPLQQGETWTNGMWYGKQYWTLFDVENFVNRISVLPIKSLTYTHFQLGTKKSPTVTFFCDEKFPFSFMEFLATQRIYCGYDKCYAGDKDFFTLETAKASFPT